MSSMIERMAKAMRKESTGSEDGWAYEVGKAYAALGAMREPTDEMTWQGSKARAGTGSLSGAENTVATWKAMIDAALNEPPTREPEDG